ncbi:unnamed protein product, partial [Closterium sp. NIES-53]
PPLTPPFSPPFFPCSPQIHAPLCFTAPRIFAAVLQILRVIDSLQLTAKYSVATPVDWKHGDDVIVAPSVSNEAAKDKFPKGFK